jgi:hypothetical protein
MLHPQHLKENKSTLMNNHRNSTSAIKPRPEASQSSEDKFQITHQERELRSRDLPESTEVEFLSRLRQPATARLLTDSPFVDFRSQYR